MIRGCDCWPIIREELAGVALLQWPWSARAMDEAAAALDALEPDAAVTYAEAGGWGRALVLECRRRGIPIAGLQHGFIYRHWLNYLHEADEMAPDPGNPADRRLPAAVVDAAVRRVRRAPPDRRRAFPARTRLRVTGSPRLDELVAAACAPDRRRSRQRARDGGRGRRATRSCWSSTKHSEAQRVLPRARRRRLPKCPTVQLAIKTHPAETPDVYAALAARPAARERAAARRRRSRRCCAASRAVVTVNSTVALDAAVLGMPALVIGLPNNLSPFVEAGLMAARLSRTRSRAALAPNPV